MANDAVTTPPTPKRWSQRMLAAIAVCGIVCAAVGAYYVFGPKPAKRASMAFNGQLSTTVYVVPRTGSGVNLKFDAFLSQPGPDVTANYMLLDGRAYWSIEKDAVITSAGCLEADQLPPVQLMQASLTDAVVVSSVDDQKIECPSGKLLQLQFTGETAVANHFVHSVGNNELSPPTRTFAETWGSIQDHAPCCLSVAFAHYEFREGGISDGMLHDGVVDYNCCSVGFTRFATDAMAGTNYKASINRFDASFRNGDGRWGADRKPVKWFECAL
ncbi:hypothetical protein SDRG_13405 [Saprolegnia diclina VS20]|uniref:Uncharacterized protein n=1 Tax=Saprolegnia diclina (strain VS20) TaxID=1156394 RepID=T0Q629_SAPDV|nr:hypothetical protein SDRG_13405 [Saprolegnia diclina VS20]EQC28895.1 hypothetical protein SDRG_13405 [Saprolegnia diclina VS20]|eukprot:XP_008617712.1 hypothetical protein SDRG_13405 [Saprolegnia diclina VS20]